RRLMQQFASYLQKDEPLNVGDLERYLLLINDLPGVDARGILSPSQQAGAANLRIITTRDPFDALVQIDNHGSRYLGPLQLTGAGSLNNFFGVNDRVTGQLVLAPDLGGADDLELGYLALAYMQ